MSNPAKHQRPYPKDQSVGAMQLKAYAHTVPLLHNIMNMRVAEHNIGTQKWFKAIMAGLRRYDYPELRPIIGTRDNPKTPHFISRRWDRIFRKWTTLRKTVGEEEGRAKLKAQNDLRKNGPPKHNKRLMKALDSLNQCPLKWMSWLTVIVPPSLCATSALTALENEGKKLERVIRKKFPHCKFVIVPEDDLVLVKNLCPSLFRDARWKQHLPANQVVFKNHFHCIIYAPGVRPAALERQLRYTPGGKRTKAYGGKKQILAKPVNLDPASDDGGPDVHGCYGYSSKRFFVSDTPNRTLETAPEWFWLTHQIESDPKLIRTGGFNTPIMDFCEDCETYHLMDDNCECGPLFQVDHDFYDDHHFVPTDGVSEQELDLVLQEPTLDSSSDERLRPIRYLNYVAATIWKKTAIWRFGGKKPPRSIVTRILSAAWKWLFPSNGP